MDCSGCFEVGLAVDFQVFRCRRLVAVFVASDILDNPAAGNLLEVGCAT